MKRIISLFGLLFSVFTINAQSVPEGSYADKLTYFINAGASNFDALYDGVIPINETQLPKNFAYVLTGVMDSSYSFLANNTYGSTDLCSTQFIINYSEGSNYYKEVKKGAIKKARKEVAMYFDSIAKLPNYKLTSGQIQLWFTKNMYLYKNNILLASYHDKRKGMQGHEPNIEGDFSIIFYEQPRIKILADEAIYNGVFPNTLIKTTEPQVWEDKKTIDGKEYISRWNGIFSNDGHLKVGNKTYHGYGPLYDGTWYSENWEYGNVKFTPEGSTDVVCGYFKNKKTDINDFYLKDHFYEKFKSVRVGSETRGYEFSTNYDCNWVKNVYNPFDAPRKTAQDIKDSKRQKEVNLSNAEYYKNNPQNTSTNNNTVLTYCPICNGSGKVIDKVVTDTRYETTHYKTCPRCNGSGR